MIGFETQGHTGDPIYHTDVFMYVGTNMIGICLDIIKPEYLDQVTREINKYHDVMLLEKDQLLDFCGNAIELRNQDDEKFLIMSSRAREALHVSQEEFLLNHFKEIIHADLSTIELYGGGSARCMVTELM